MNCTVKLFKTTRGFGVIAPEGGRGKDIFVHISAVERAGRTDGQKVTFDVKAGRDSRESATNLKLA